MLKGDITTLLLQLMKSLFTFAIKVITCYGVSPTIQTSSARELLGCSIFSAYSLLKSACIGAFYGWKYGLTSLGILRNGISIFYYELYTGISINETDSVHVNDPWSFNPCGLLSNDTVLRPLTNITDFFKANKEKRTLADIANEVHASKPSSLQLNKPLGLVAT